MHADEWRLVTEAGQLKVRSNNQLTKRLVMYHYSLFTKQYIYVHTALCTSYFTCQNFDGQTPPVWVPQVVPQPTQTRGTTWYLCPASQRYGICPTDTCLPMTSALRQVPGTPSPHSLVTTSDKSGQSESNLNASANPNPGGTCQGASVWRANVRAPAGRSRHGHLHSLSCELKRNYMVTVTFRIALDSLCMRHKENENRWTPELVTTGYNSV